MQELVLTDVDDVVLHDLGEAAADPPRANARGGGEGDLKEPALRSKRPDVWWPC